MLDSTCSGSSELIKNDYRFKFLIYIYNIAYPNIENVKEEKKQDVILDLDLRTSDSVFTLTLIFLTVIFSNAVTNSKI